VIPNEITEKINRKDLSEATKTNSNLKLNIETNKLQDIPPEPRKLCLEAMCCYHENCEISGTTL